MSSFNTFVGIYFFPLFYKPPFLSAINTKMFLLDGHYQLSMVFLPPVPQMFISLEHFVFTEIMG